MTTNRRILTPMVATIAAAFVVGAATLGGTFAADDAVNKKADRFALAGDSLCAGQTWPNLTPECLAWQEGEFMPGDVRFVTIASHDNDTGVTTLTRTRNIPTN